VAKLVGSTGDDQITGTSGDDLILPLTGSDRVDGGAGRDRLVLDYSAFRVGDFIFGPYTYAHDAALDGVLKSMTSADYVVFSNIERLDVKLGDRQDRYFFRADAPLAGQRLSVDGGGNFDILFLTLTGIGDVRLRLSDNGTLNNNLGLHFASFEAFWLRLGDGRNTITTGAASDDVRAGNGINRITTGAGGDTVYVGTGTNTISMGDGNDDVHCAGGLVRFDGGEGDDWLEYGTVLPIAGRHTLTVDGLAQTARLGRLVEAVNVEEVTFALGDAANRIVLTDARALVGDTGGDNSFTVIRPVSVTISGGTGLDRAFVAIRDTSAGYCEIRVGRIGGLDGNIGGSCKFEGMDYLTAVLNANNNQVSVDAAALVAGTRLRIDAGAGVDTLFLDLSALFAAPYTIDAGGTLRVATGTFVGFEHAIVTGTAGNDELSGFAAGGNRIKGGAGNDVFHDSPGDDVLDGGDGNDTFYVVGGSDQIDGGLGDDTYYVGSSTTAQVIDPGGFDTVYTSAGGGFDVDRVYLTGNATDTTIAGGGSDNLLVGNGGHNVLFGGFGNDTLQGGDGFDELYGEEGADRLTGGAGGDFFHFSVLESSKKRDVITDFLPGTDTLTLSRTAFPAFADAPFGARLLASAFVAGSAAATPDQHIIYDRTTGHLSYDYDGSGSEEQILIAILTTKPDLAASDIVLW